MIHGLDWLEKMPRDRGHRVGDVTQDVEAHGLGNGEHLGVLGALQLEPEGTGHRRLERGSLPHSRLPGSQRALGPEEDGMQPTLSQVHSCI